jgi:hypothetical protein
MFLIMVVVTTTNACIKCKELFSKKKVEIVYDYYEENKVKTKTITTTKTIRPITSHSCKIYKRKTIHYDFQGKIIRKEICKDYPCKSDCGNSRPNY